jgi:glycosyltransferase involved in cell wall biosynthesis
LLRECLHALERQSRPPDALIVVDNASTDGTGALLAEEFPHLSVLHLPENSGGAGGFSAGMRWAYDHGFDWAWVMDDDVEALPNALESMLAYSGISKFIHFRREGPDGITEIEGIWDIGSCQFVPYGQDLSFRMSDRDWVSVQWACFEGALLHRDVMREVGFPDVRYFIAGDDSMYGFEASFHTTVIYARPVALRRKFPQPVNRSRMTYYFSVRNRFLHYEHLLRLGVPVNKKLFWVETVNLFAWSVKHILAEGGGRMSNVRAVISGLSDGVRGIYGRPTWLR